MLSSGGLAYMVVTGGTAGVSSTIVDTGVVATNGTLVLRRAKAYPRRGMVLCNKTSGVIYVNFGPAAEYVGAAVPADGSFSFSFADEVEQAGVCVWSATNGIVCGLEW